MCVTTKKRKKERKIRVKVKMVRDKIEEKSIRVRVVRFVGSVRLGAEIGHRRATKGERNSPAPFLVLVDDVPHVR